MDWLQPFAWSQDEAFRWLHRTRRRFDVVLEDLSVPLDADITKPTTTWGVLPGLVADRLRRGGLAVFNLLQPPNSGWDEGLRRVAAPFPESVVLSLKDFENRILIAGECSFPARTTGSRIRQALRRLGSEQADRLAVQTVTSVRSPH